MFEIGHRSLFVVLDSMNGNEMTFLQTESMGTRAINMWPLDERRMVMV
jgi:hypothetical protein